MALELAHKYPASIALDANHVTIQAELPYNLAEIREFAREVRATCFDTGEKVTFALRPLHVFTGDAEDLPRLLVTAISDLIDLDPDAEDEHQAPASEEIEPR